MFEGFVGDKTFQQGMRAYIQEHKFGNATATDLVDAIATAAGKGDRFKQAFMSFLNQPGVPYVQTEVTTQGGKTVLKLSQSRYLPYGSTGDTRQVWGVPMCVRYGTAAGSKVSCELFDQAHGTMTLADASQPTWVMPNANGLGYYRFAMHADDLARLAAQVGKLGDAEQLAYADAVAASFRRGDVDAASALAALRPLTRSTVREVATAPLDTFDWIRTRLASTAAQHAKLAAWATSAYLPRMQQLGYVRKAGEAADDALLRSSLANLLALDVKVPAVRAALLAQGDAILKRTAEGRLDVAAGNPDLLGDALGVAVQERGQSVVAELIAQLPKTSDARVRNAILSGLSSTVMPPPSQSTEQ